jgi:hypothetical protein
MYTGYIREKMARIDRQLPAVANDRDVEFALRTIRDNAMNVADEAAVLLARWHDMQDRKYGLPLAHLRVYFVVEGSPEPVGYIHEECRKNVPAVEDGYDVIVDGCDVQPKGTPCMYCNQDEAMMALLDEPRPDYFNNETGPQG